MKRSFYKKVFVIGVALFVLFSPIGLTTKEAASSPIKLNAPQILPSLASSFSLALKLNLAEATTTETTGAGAGSATVQNPNLFSCTINAATCGVYYVALVLNGIAGVGLSIAAFAVRLGLQFNDNVFNSPAVQTGFSVSLAIANLGFILGIIIIALATIIRNQTYGIKQLLWKLVVMAILVNFGLVITAPIVGFASDMSNYFINAISPQSTTVAGYEGFASTMTAAFAPQDLTQGGGQTGNATTVGVSTGVTAGCSGTLAGGVPGLCALLGKIAGALTPSDSLWQMTMALCFDVFFSFLTLFVFACLAVLLIVRYLMLGGLLIVLPLAWLTWIFPKFDSSFSKWWNTFIKWVFFPPLALFFLYLAFITATNTGGAGNTYLTQATQIPTNADTGVEAGIVEETGIGGGPIQQAADEILLAGLTIMGLMFANSLAGKAGSTVVNAGASASKAVGGYVGKQTKKGARAGFRKVGGTKAVQKMREGQLGGLQKIPLVGWAAGRGASLAGRALEPHLVNKEIVDEAKKKVPENIEQVKQNLKGNMNTEDRLAHIAKLIEKGELSKDQMVGNENIADFLDKNQNMIKNYSFEKSYKDLDKVLMSTANSRNAARAIKNRQKEVVVVKDVKDENGNVIYKEGTKAEPKALKEAAEKQFYTETPKADFAKSKVNELFSPKAEAENPDEFQNKLNNIFNYRPEIAPDLMKKMNGITLGNFAEPYGKMLNAAVEESKARKDALTASIQAIRKLGVPTQQQAADLEQLESELEKVTAKHYQWTKRRQGFDRAYGSIFGSAATEDRGGESGGKKEEGDKH